MAARKSTYRRLTGRKRTFLGFSQLWIAPDHILLVKSTRFAEQYRHFALGDIQAIVVTGLPGRTQFQVGATAASILWALMFLTVDSRFAQGFFAATGVLALALVIADIARGPRCRCYLYTAISRERLAPVARLRAARTFLDQVRPAIEAVQGVFTPDILALPAIDRMPAAATGEPPEIPQPPGHLPEVLFGLFLIDAALILIGYRFPGVETGGVLVTTLLAEVVILIAALIRRGQRDTRRIIYVLMIAAILCIGWDAAGVARGLMNWMGSMMEEAQRGRAVSPTLPTRLLFHRSEALFAAGWRIAAGAMGLVFAHLERK